MGPDHTSKQVAGVLATEVVSSMFPYCYPSSSNKSNSSHPFSNGAKGLATFLLKPTASNDERFLSKNLVPVRRKSRSLACQSGGTHKHIIQKKTEVLEQEYECPMECKSLCDFARSNRPVASFFLECDQEAVRKPDAQQLHAQPHFPW